MNHKFIIYILLILSVNIAYSQTWKEQYDSANYYLNNGDYKTALDWSEKTLDIANKSLAKSDTNFAKTTRLMTDVYYYLGQYEKSVEYGKLDSSVCRNIYGSNHPTYAESISNLAMVYKKLSLYNAVEALYKESIQILKNYYGVKHPDYATALNNLAMHYQNMARFSEAEPLFKEAIDVVRNFLNNQHPNYGAFLFNLGSLYKKMGSYSKAEPLYLEAIEIDKKNLGAEHSDYAIDLSNLAGLYETMGKYNDAESLYLDAIRILKNKLGNKHPYVATSTSGLALLYKKMGRYAESEKLFDESLAIIKESLGEQHPSYAIMLSNLGLIYEASDKFDDAESSFQKAIQITKNKFGVEHPRYFQFLNYLGCLYFIEGKIDGADSILNEAVNRTGAKMGANYPTLSEYLTNLGNLYYSSSQYNKAEKIYLQALNIAKEAYSDNHPNYSACLRNLAILYRDMNRMSEAEELFKTSLKIDLNNLYTLFPSLSEKEKSLYYNTIKNRFESFNSFAIDRLATNPSITGVMYNFQIATKAILLSATKKVRERILGSHDSVLISKFELWQSKKDYLAKLYTLSKTEIAKQNVNLDTLKDQINRLEKELSKQSEIFSKEFEKQEITWQNIRNLLADDEAAIEIIRFRKYNLIPNKYNKSLKVNDFSDSVVYVALVITKNTKDFPAYVILRNGSQLETNYLTQYRHAIKFAYQDIDSYNAYFSSIYNILNKNIKILDISLDGVYNQINLNGLLNLQTKKYVIQELNLRLLTNTKDLIAYKNNVIKYEKNNIELFGGVKFDLYQNNNPLVPSLPGTKFEIDTISNILNTYKWTSTIFSDTNATEDELKKIHSPRVLHIATHGVFLDSIKVSQIPYLSKFQEFTDDPLFRSMLLFAGSANTLWEKKNPLANNDGILSAFEAMNLDLDNTELVALSACETGLGEVKNGEGVYGLQRAFYVAGAKALIMSLWKVDDEATSQLMTHFYSYWLGGMTKREAFRKSQLDLMANYNSEYYWSAFLFVGE